MTLLAIAIVGIVAVLIITAVNAGKQGQREAADRLIEAVKERERAEFTSKAGQDAFRSSLRQCSDLELRQGMLLGLETELELEAHERDATARNDFAHLAKTRLNLEQVRLRISWVQEEYTRRGVQIPS